MNIWHICSAIITAYLLGSIPSAIWYGEAYFGIDVRKFGSGNAGATNTFRVLGKRAGTIVLLIDVLKGWTATKLASILFFLEVIQPNQVPTFKLILGFAAVLGHLYPIFVRFKGGKGVATSLGMILAIDPLVASVCIVIFVLVLLVSHYVSLSSIIAAFAFPMMLVLGIFGKASTLLIVFGFLLFAVVVITHQKNIVRLLNGNESRVNLWGRRK
ncbi:glycerol-3-phosphate 1-O-acyltransferase PlsY [Runella sp. CRIBMP]|uniref:Glycerol-3-phosphate acyltransferase n=2 Tax=Runella TaxID=105 RepID=A0A369IFR0_9BACT|nr:MULTISPECIES: glycerol-3-phosphate 1-O-acyltransferase PlsY [Runella]MCP1383331.1 glycerol-3-phosphate 1-O-acyltransferase PlsY [Runella salmonicolor]NBB20191.1 glycerol-3-phosphate 1-O-acyltransferase PlsY [Runella sp. CRIBMP]RDB07055.1 glycerol-3-phosphate 1-O-acyltransferase [Runella aurantiaca]